uniref:CRAL-TRIO domain-containing protein n=1 Tax=Palpitomonas bilix TaxID=652834 RepID=A0A7S3G6M9_9EUKA
MWEGLDITEKEKAAVDELKEKLGDLTQRKGFLSLTDKLLSEDHACFRYVRGYNCNVKTAFQKVAATIEWRETFAGDDYETKHPELFANLKRTYVGRALGVITDDGSALDYYDIDYFNPGATNRVDVDDIAHYHFSEIERGLKLQCDWARTNGKDYFPGFITLINAKGVGMQHAAPNAISTIKKLFGPGQDNFPENMKVCYILNTPAFFAACWKLIEPMLSKRTREKVKVLRGDFSTMEDSELPCPRELIPEPIGGKLKIARMRHFTGDKVCPLDGVLGADNMGPKKSVTVRATEEELAHIEGGLVTVRCYCLSGSITLAAKAVKDGEAPIGLLEKSIESSSGLVVIEVAKPPEGCSLEVTITNNSIIRWCNGGVDIVDV